MIDLKTLIRTAQHEVAKKELAKTLVSKAKTSKSVEARTEAMTEARAIQATIDWRTQSVVFHEYCWHCICGSLGFQPDGLYLHQEHTRLANAWRMVRPKHEVETQGGHPKRTKITQRTVEICSDCAPALGFATPYVEPPRAQPKTPAHRGEGQYLTEWRSLTKAEPEEAEDV